MAKITLDKWIVILTVASAALLQLIDTSIVNVALRPMMGNLGATLAEISWVITAYSAANVVMIALAGWMGARFGRKRYFAMSIIIFTAASVACGMSTNVWMLIFFRFLQGIGGGGIMTTAQSIIVETFPREQLGFANAIYGMTVIIGPTIGPTLGGYITDNLSWNWVFYVNLPFGIFATLMTFIYVKEPDEKQRIGKMDWWGLAFLCAGVGALQVMLERGQDDGWFESSLINALMVISVVGIIAFIWRELSIEFPVVNLRLFRSKSFTMGSCFGFILGFGLFSSVFIIPMFTQVFLGFTATKTGLMMIPGSLVTAISMPFVGKALQRNIPPQYMSAVGMTLFFVFCVMLYKLSGVSSESEFFWPLILRGLGMGLLFIPLTSITLSEIEGRDIPQATGLSNMVRQLGGSFGVALMTAFLSFRTSFHRDVLAEKITETNPAAMDRINAMVGGLMAKGSGLLEAKQKALASLNMTVARQAALLSYLDAFLVVGIFFLICIPILLLYKNKQRPKATGEKAPEAHMVME